MPQIRLGETSAAAAFFHEKGMAFTFFAVEEDLNAIFFKLSLANRGPLANVIQRPYLCQNFA